MDAITVATTPAPQNTNWDSVYGEVNAWRGECVHHFSAVEMAVTETLLALSEAPLGGATVRLRHLIGMRLEDLTAATGVGSPFEELASVAHAELLQYRGRHEAFRNQLCHGFVKVAVERSGPWILVLRATSLHAGKAERSTLVLDRSEALARLEALKRDGQKLGSVLGQLRRAVVR